MCSLFNTNPYNALGRGAAKAARLQQNIQREGRAAFGASDTRSV